MSIHVHENEPYRIENGRLWYNPDDGETRAYHDGEWVLVPTVDYLRGVEEERERIIKLLEENHKRGISDSTCGVCKFLDSSIELIKGENK